MKRPSGMFRFSLIFCAVLFSFFMIPNSSVLAQDLDEVTISGRIADQNGAIIPGATVTAVLITNNQERTAIADAEGRYRLIELQPGTYDLRATAANFGVREQKGLVTISGQNVQMDFTLAPAGVNETTVVVDEETASPVDTTRTVVGGTVTQREIEELPNTDRSPLNLIFTLGNVAEEPLSTRDVAEDRSVAGVNQARAPLEAGIFSLSGGAAYSNNITIDGLDNNDDRLAQERFQPSVDAIAEVQVITNQFSAEYGRASGGRVNIRTRAGTNKFRGRAFFYFRDEQLNANTYNNNRRGLSRLPFTEVNPGGTFSGPIPFGYFKNKTFFFSSYEFNNFDNTTRIDTVVPVGQNPLLALPSPTGAPRNENIPNNPAQIAPYITSVKTPSRTHTFTQRIDHNFTDNHNVTFNYQLGRRRNFRQYLETTRIIDDVLQGTIRNTDAFYITDNYVFSPKLVNQFRFQYSRFKPDFGTANPNDPVALITIRDTATQAENRSGTLTAGNSTANFASTRQESRHQFQDNLTYVTGPHSLKFGADVQVIESVNNNLGDATGTFNFDSVSDFLSNRVLRFRRNFGLTSALKNTYYGVYIQDEWRARSNLTVSLGLRYENEIIIDDNNNFGPRAAIAYSPFKTGKGVIRVGGGIFYNRALLRTIDDYTVSGQRNFDTRLIAGPSTDNQCFVEANFNQPRCVFLRSIGLNNVPTEEQIRSSTIPGVSTAFTNVTNFQRRIDNTLKIPESYQFNVGFEREIGDGYVFETNYTLNRTIRLWREVNINAPRLPGSTADLSGDGQITFTDYLLGITTGPNRYFLGSTTDTVGASTTMGGTTACTAATPVCFINLNTLNSSGAANGPVGRALASIGSLRPIQGLTQVEQVSSLGRSFYQGVSFELRKRFRQLGYGFGGSFRLVYTLSKLKDDGIVNTSSAQIPGRFDLEESRATQDRRHRLNFSGTFEFPKWLGKLRVSPLLRLASSSPFNISIGAVDRNLDDVNGDRPNFNGNLNDLRFRNPGDPFNTALVSAPYTQGLTLAPIGTPGNLSRNAGRGPGFFTFDTNFSREFRFTERIRLRPNIEIDNIFNARVLTFSSDFINFNNLTTADFQNNFLVPQRALRPRQIRLGLRFDF